MRDLSEIISNILESESQPVFLAADITLPESEQTIRFAEIDLSVSSVNLFGTSVPTTTTFYEGLLKSEPSIKFSKGKSPSGGELVIHDIDHAFGVLTGQIESALENSTIVLTTCWEKSDGNFEADVYFVGKIRDVKSESNTTSFLVIADTDVKTAVVANRSLTQRCLADFGDDRCRRPAELIAPGETCSNIYDDAENGCLSKRWQFAYWGVPILTLNSDNTSNGGWGGGTVVTGGGDCISVENFIAIVDMSGSIQQIRAKRAEQGLIVVDALQRTAVIEKVEFLFSDSMLEVLCENGAKLECSESEPLIFDVFDAVGTPAKDVAIGQEILTFNLQTQKEERSKIKSIKAIPGREIAKITLSNSSASLFLACVADDNEFNHLMICIHNRKNHTIIQI